MKFTKEELENASKNRAFRLIGVDHGVYVNTIVYAPDATTAAKEADIQIVNSCVAVK